MHACMLRYTIRDHVMAGWIKTAETYYTKDPKVRHWPLSRVAVRKHCIRSVYVQCACGFVLHAPCFSP